MSKTLCQLGSAVGHRGARAKSLLTALFAVAATACGSGSVEPGALVHERYETVRKRLIDEHLVNGVVVSLARPDAQASHRPPHNRDALLHTSLTLASVPCNERPLFLAGIASLEIEPGRYVRYLDFPKNDQISRDMIVGLVFGLAQTYRNCPELRGPVRSRMLRLLGYIDAHAGSLGVGPASKLSGASRAAVHFAAKLIGVHPGPSSHDKAALALQATLLPAAVIGTATEFYAVHLTVLELILWTWAEDFSPELKTIHQSFCYVAETFDNPLYAGLCGQAETVTKALQTWDYSCIEYRWQAAKPMSFCEPQALQHPGHDFLLLYSLFVRGGLLAFFQPKIDGAEFVGAAAMQFAEVL